MTVFPEAFVLWLTLVVRVLTSEHVISERPKFELGLPVVGRDSLLIKTFGQSDARLRSCEMVQVGIKTAHGATVYVQAYVVPVICGLPHSATS